METRIYRRSRRRRFARFVLGKRDLVSLTFSQIYDICLGRHLRQSLPVRRVRALCHSHISTNRADRWSILSNVQTTLNLFTAHTCVRVCTPRNHHPPHLPSAHPHDYRGSMWRRDCDYVLYTRVLTHIYCSPTVKCIYVMSRTARIHATLRPPVYIYKEMRIKRDIQIYRQR